MPAATPARRRSCCARTVPRFRAARRPARSRRTCDRTGGSAPPSATCRAGSCSAPPTTTAFACSTPTFPNARTDRAGGRPRRLTEPSPAGRRPAGTVGMGYGCVFGRCERKAIAMAVLDAVLSGVNDDVPFESPLADEELVLSHVDSVEAAGFVEHLKLPHEVTFASDLDRIESIRSSHG